MAALCGNVKHLDYFSTVSYQSRSHPQVCLVVYYDSMKSTITRTTGKSIVTHDNYANRHLKALVAMTCYDDGPPLGLLMGLLIENGVLSLGCMSSSGL